LVGLDAERSIYPDAVIDLVAIRLRWEQPERFLDERGRRLFAASAAQREGAGCSATIKMDAVLPHPGMLPSRSSIASPECSRRHVSLSIDYMVLPFAV
jgi:hypothetical protein